MTPCQNNTAAAPTRLIIEMITKAVIEPTIAGSIPGGAGGSGLSGHIVFP